MTQPHSQGLSSAGRQETLGTGLPVIIFITLQYETIHSAAYNNNNNIIITFDDYDDDDDDDDDDNTFI